VIFMPTPIAGELLAGPSHLVAQGAGTTGLLTAARFLSSADNDRVRMPRSRASPTVAGIPLFMQIAAPQTDNQIHNEQLMLADEQWSYRREKLASPGRCPTVTI
jgi:hypothetical protein